MTGLRSGALATAAGVNQQTLRYYERRGLLAEPQRSLGGHRVYPPEAVTQVRIIKAAQRLGFTLSEIIELIDLGRQHGRSRVGLQTRVADKLAEIEAKIADLTVIRDTLRDAARAGCQDLHTCARTPNCPLPFTELAETGG